MTQKRLSPAVRKREILAAALELADLQGYTNVTRDAIAAKAGVSGPAVQYHFGTMTQLLTALMRHAVKARHPRVVAQGLTARNPHALKADDELKRLARESL